MPYGAIPIFTFPTVRLAMALRDAGYPVKLIKCHQSIISTCSVHQILKQETDIEQMKRTCSWCRSYQDDLFRISGLDGYVLPDYKVSVELPNDFQGLSNFVFQGYQIGKVALHQFRFILAYSKELSSHRDLELLKNTIRGLTGFIKALDKMTSVIPENSHIFLNNWTYPVHAIMHQWAMKLKLDVINFNAAGISTAHQKESFFMSRLATNQWLRELAEVVENNLDKLKFSNEEVYAYSLYNYRNQSGYSSYSFSTRHQPKIENLYTHLDLPDDGTKKIVTCFLSSQDEQKITQDYKDIHGISEPNKIVENQEDWMSLIFHSLDAFENTIFLIRPHPREMKIDAENTKWLSSYNNRHPRFIIVEDSALVSNDFLEISDAVLISYSTVGVSALERGLPVISICPEQTSVPISKDYRNIKSKKSYIKAIKHALNNDINLQNYKILGSSYGALFHGRSAAFFEHNNFWQKNSGTQGLDPKEKERRKRLDLPILDFAEYCKSWRIKDDEFLKITNFLDKRIELYNHISTSQEKLISASETYDLSQKFYRNLLK